MRIVCEICPHKCRIAPGKVGICGTRTNEEGAIKSMNYGVLTAIALDPIEKKPLYHFFPGTKILSVGSWGCNLKCPFCQNHRISMAKGALAGSSYVSAEELVKKALMLRPAKNIGIAHTYNEPFISYEYVMDVSVLAKKEGLKNILVTNGYVCKEPLEEILPLIDAMNVDLKAFNDEFYRNIGGDLESVKRTIEVSYSKCHVEVTTLIVPGENDDKKEIEKLVKWLASLDKNIVYHISAFFPNYKYTDKKATSFAKIYELVDLAKKHLNHVYPGNC